MRNVARDRPHFLVDVLRQEPTAGTSLNADGD